MVLFSVTALNALVPNFCSPETASNCVVDGFVGTEVIYEDHDVKVWNFTLAPNDMTSMHKHDCDYHFVAIKPTEVEVYGESGRLLVTVTLAGTLGFKVEGDELVQTKPSDAPPNFVPIRVPRIHAARNVGNSPYYEILFESKASCVDRAEREIDRDL